MPNESKSSRNWDREVDLLIAGAGAGGMTAALVAKLEGLEALVCEKTDQVGGTASTSAGTVWIPGNRQSLDAGWTDNADAARTYMTGMTGRSERSALLEAFLESGPVVMDYLQAKSDVKFALSGKHPDYKDLPGAAVYGRTLAPVTFDGRQLGDDFNRVRPPIAEFMVLGGMMVGKEDIPKLINRFKSTANFVHAGKLFLRYLTDRLRFRRGTRVTMGNALVSRLFYSLKRNSVPVLFNTHILELVMDSGTVTGALVSVDGKKERIRVRKGVVLATGGYGHNANLRRQYMMRPTPPYSVAAKSNTGDGIELGLRNGGTAAPELHGTGAFWAPVSVVKRSNGSEGVFPHLSLDRAKPGLIAVNSAAKRFVNEGASYHDFVVAMYVSQRTATTIPAYIVCEKAFVTRYGLGHIHPGTTNLRKYEANGYLVVEPTLAALAVHLKLDPAQLEATVKRHNEFAETGVDLDFGKGSTELSRFNGDVNNKPNPCLKRITTGPFVGLAVWPAEIATSTGLQTNENGQVLDEHNAPIPGLYACGNDMASVMSGTYPGPGTTLGPALTFGYRVAFHAAGKSSKQ